jgi:hypothetical protein
LFGLSSDYVLAAIAFFRTLRSQCCKIPLPERKFTEILLMMRSGKKLVNPTREAKESSVEGWANG